MARPIAQLMTTDPSEWSALAAPRRRLAALPPSRRPRYELRATPCEPGAHRTSRGSWWIFPGPGLPKPDPRAATPPYATKTALYEILGPPGTTGVANWMDAESLPQNANFTTLPWSTTTAHDVPW